MDGWDDSDLCVLWYVILAPIVWPSACHALIALRGVMLMSMLLGGRGGTSVP